MLDRAFSSMRSMRAATRVNGASGRRSSVGSQRGGTGRRARRLDARRAQHAQRLIHQRGKAAPPFALHQLGAQRQARQRIHRVVQVEQQLAPLHGRQIGLQRQRQARAREQRQPRSRRHIVLRGQHPLRAAVQMAGRQLGHIEGHHGRHDAQLRRNGLRACRLVDAVCNDSSGVPAGSTRASCAAAASVPALLTASNTRPGAAPSGGSSDASSASGATCNVGPSTSLSVKPCVRSTFTTRGRPMKCTRAPAAASRPPTQQPTEPAPMTHTDSACCSPTFTDQIPAWRLPDKRWQLCYR